jgi:molybdenum cofactor cytidylyltransferase
MDAVPLPRLAVVILAAGFSSRLGRPKALARLRGISLLRRTAAVATRLSPTELIVVIPRQATTYRMDARGLALRFVHNPRRAEGLSSSVQRGIAAARYSSALLLLPVDLPTLQYRDLAQLVSHWRAARRCVIARRVGHGSTARGGVPLILPRWLYAQARGVRADVGLRDFIGGLPSAQRVLLNLPSAALDIDTPDDLRAARRRATRSGAVVQLRYSRALCTNR